MIILGKYNFECSNSSAKNNYLSSLQEINAFEIGFSKFLERIIPNNNCLFIDIGAHLGYFVLYSHYIADQHTNTKLNVIAIEPSPKNYEALVNNVKNNNLYDSVITFCVAAASNNGTQKFYYNSKFDHSNSLYDHSNFTEGDSGKNIYIGSVDTITLDSLIKYTNPDQTIIIKIDTEGAELEILKGAEKMLNQFQNLWFVCELHQRGLKEMGHSVENLRQFMLKHGFATFSFSGDYKYSDGELPRWIPPQTEIKQKHIVNILFARMDNISNYWQDVFVDAT